MDATAMQRALSLQEAGQLDAAAGLFQDILRSNPGHFAAAYSLGVIHLQSGQFGAAADLLGQAIALNPRFPNAWYARANALIALKRWPEALGSLDQAIGLQPGFADALAARVTVLRELGRLSEARLSAEQVLALRPESAPDWNALGLVLFAMQRVTDSLEAFDRALSLEPALLDAIANRATALLEMQRFDEALAGFDAVIEADAANAIAYNNRGNVFLALKRFEEAIADYDKALAIAPDLTLAADNRGHALLGLGRATRCPSLFLRRTFDDAAASFEQTMAGLSYRGHLDLKLVADRVLPPGAKGLRILDLGSGTGLVGEAFREFAVGGRLDGIDLSPRMIEEARRREIYNRLILGDLESVLAAPMPVYDLVLAADTMVYFGDLLSSLQGSYRCLAQNGHFLFAVEKKAGAGWEQTNANRFRHSESYLRDTAGQTGFQIAGMFETTLRYEAGQPVEGIVIALRKPPAR